MSKIEPIIDTISKEQIEQWKREYANVFRYTSSDGKVAYFRNVTLQILDAARSQAAVDQSKFKLFLMKNTFLGGNKDVIEIEKYQMGVFDWLDLQLVKVEGVMEEL